MNIPEIISKIKLELKEKYGKNILINKHVRKERHTLANYKCPKCKNTWHSAMVLVTINVNGNDITCREYGQLCKKCRTKGQCTLNVNITVERLVDAIEVALKLKEQYRHEKNNKRTLPHKIDLCGACKKGICTEGKNLEDIFDQLLQI